MRQMLLGVRVKDRALFDSFLPAHNQQALAHAMAVPGTAHAAVTWICGPTGTGKTHLLQAICAAAPENRPTGYVPLRELAGLGPGVLEGLGALDILCLDDIDCVLGRPEWEAPLFELYHALLDKEAQWVVAATSPPSMGAWSLPDLKSRFCASTIFQLRPLDEHQQQAALQLRARLRGFELPDETSRWLQRRFPRDMHTLYDLLDTLDEATLVAQRRRITVPFIRSVLQE